MRALRIVLDFEATEATPEAVAELRGYLAGLVAHQDLGTQVGPRDLERSGLVGARLIAAELLEQEDLDEAPQATT